MQHNPLLDYEKLVSEFESGLISKLRGHSSSIDFLSTWVPDNNHVLSLVGMVESALIAGIRGFRVEMNKEILASGRKEELKLEIESMCVASFYEHGDLITLEVSFS